MGNGGEKLLGTHLAGDSTFKEEKKQCDLGLVDAFRHCAGKAVQSREKHSCRRWLILVPRVS